jgi:hypothetical protein
MGTLMAAEPSGISTYLYQTPVQYWCKWILYKLTLVPQSGWPLVCGFLERISSSLCAIRTTLRQLGLLVSRPKGRADWCDPSPASGEGEITNALL